MNRLTFINSLLFVILYYFSSTMAQLSNFENCKQSEYPINLTQLIFDPNPIEIGKNLVTNVAGSNKEEIQSGAIMTATFSYNGKLIDSKQYDLCIELIESSGGKCPVEPGEFNFTVKSIPSVGNNYRPNSTYTFDTIFSGI
jgi:hypothetical protein